QAAGRPAERPMSCAILYEKGLLALDAGDNATAERDWNTLIDLALVQPRLIRPKTVASTPTRSASQGQPPPPPRAARSTGPIPATVSQFSLAAALAQAAAEKNLTAVSLRAIREALSGGLPVPDLPHTPLGGSGAPRM